MSTPRKSVNKVVRKGALNADDFKGLTDKGHIYQITDTYIGSDEQTEREEWVFRFAKNQLEKRKITVSQAVERLFLEILSNAGDNAFASRNSGVDPGAIEITMTDQVISIKNGGLPIPVEINKEMNLYAPEMIFGVLRTSSNYDPNIIRMGCGRNGFGAKLVNIFSKEFKIDVADNIRKKRYRQVWRNNMDIREAPLIEAYTGPSYVEVTYLMDFKRFAYEDEKYPAEAFALFGRLALEMSMNCKVPLVMNGVKYDVVDIQNFCKYIFPAEAIATSIVHIEQDDPLYVEICMMDTPDSGETLSYVNGMITRDGGVHVEAVIKGISNVLLERINSSKAVKMMNKDDSKKKNILTLADIRPHISLVMNCRIPNPKFTSQTKTQLSGPQLKFDFPDKLFQQVFKWSLITRLYATLEAKQMKNLQKTDGKKRRHILLEKGEDANEAGGSQSKRCTLFIVEGKSAMGYAVKAISSIPNGRNFYGILPIRGKLLNVMNAGAQQIAENEELTEIKKMLGLKEGMNYASEEAFATLRYGYVVILTDADDDGKHIMGLILNFFYCRFQSLLARGFIHYLRTPILRVYSGKTVLKFYSAGEYETWKDKTPNASSWKHRYYKGLGTSKDSDILDDFKSPKMVMCLYDDQCPDSFRLAFDSKYSNMRKTWIATWKKAFDIEDVRECPISKFINEEFIQYSVSNLHRSIPRMMDGLKVSQRKVLWAAFCHWKGQGLGHLMKGPKEIKVERFASITAEATNYHHGGNCLSETIIAMAQNFVGANNLPYFTQDGQFGTRNLGGEDAAQPRYPDTRPQEWLKYVYFPQDFPLMERAVDEGNEVEPVSFLPIIPMALINGCLGIGTGHSTFIPNCSPMEIVDWLLAKLERKHNLPVVLPWYRGFNGNIKIKTATVKEDDFFDRSESDSDEEEKEDSTPEEEKTREVTLSMVTTGKVHVDKQANIHVLELPIGIWIHKYKEFLESLLENKKLSDFSNLSTHEIPKFVIQGFLGKPTFDKLKLRRTYGLTNMVLLDMNNIPRKYKSIDGLMEEFYRLRLPYYALRKQRMLEDILARISVLEDKYKFLKLVIEDKIVIFKKSKQEILQQMKVHKLPEDLLTSVRLSSLSEDELTELSKEIDGLKSEMEEMQKLNPEDMWIHDLKEFKKKYIEMFGKDIKEELEGDELEEEVDDETIPYTKPKKEKKKELTEFQAKKISKVGQRLKNSGDFIKEGKQEVA
jgi:DNA topoisomerase-2